MLDLQTWLPEDTSNSNEVTLTTRDGIACSVGLRWSSRESEYLVRSLVVAVLQWSSNLKTLTDHDGLESWLATNEVPSVRFC